MYFTKSAFKKAKTEKGAAAVEFALLLPLLSLILFGIITFGQIFNYYLEITHAAREGARWAALREPLTSVQTKTKDAAPGLDVTKMTVTMTIGGQPSAGATSDDQGEPARVTVAYPISDIKSIFGDMFGYLPDAISSASVEKVE